MRIGSPPRIIGPDQPPYIIAELGVNHDGDVQKALDLTRAAAQAGADAVKLQLFETDLLMSKAAKLAAYQKAAGETDPIAMLRRLELSIDDMARVVALAHELGIHAIVTVFSVELVAKAETLPWDAYKTASPDIVHKPLLEALAATGKPLIISTGASTMDEVKQAIHWLTATPPARSSEPSASGSGRTISTRDRLAVMQCVSCYPTPAEHAELGGIRAIADATGMPTGYSDHTSAIVIGHAAVTCGAALLEKHMTHRQLAAGPDHAASLEAHAFFEYGSMARWARGVSNHTLAFSLAHPELVDRTVAWKDDAGREYLQPIIKRVLLIEQDVRTVSRQSITTRRSLSRGHVLRREDLTFKRPGTGLLPFRLEETLGRQLTRDVEGDVPLTEEDLR